MDPPSELGSEHGAEHGSEHDAEHGSEHGAEHGSEHDALVVAAGIGASPGHCVPFLLSPFLDDEAGDLGSACEAEPIHVSMWFLLELDGLVLLETGSAGLYVRSGHVEVLDEDSRFHGWRNSHKLVDKPGVVEQLQCVGDVLWRVLLLLDSTSLHVLL